MVGGAGPHVKEEHIEIKQELSSHCEAETSMLRVVRAYAGPYPQWGLPTPDACKMVAERLSALHGWPSALRKQGHKTVGCEERRSVLDSLVRTLLSQNTTDITSQRAFDSLKQRYPSWDAVRLAPMEEVADAIRVGGLAEIKATRIQSILQALAAERGQCCMEHLRLMPPAQVKAELSRFKGVGPKTIACVLLFSLEQPDFAVDTHVWEITKALGWVPVNCSRDQAYEHLNELVPDELKYDLHVLLVRHGKECPACAKAGSAKQRGAAAAGVDCPLADLKVPKGKLKAASPAGSKQRSKGRGKGSGGGAAAAVPAGSAEAAAEAAVVRKAGSKRRKVKTEQAA